MSHNVGIHSTVNCFQFETVIMLLVTFLHMAWMWMCPNLMNVSAGSWEPGFLQFY